MPFIKTIPEAEASGDVRKMYDDDRKGKNYLPNYSKVFSLRPAVKEAWNGLLKSIKSNMDARRYELVTVAAARALKSSYCMLAHGSILGEKFYTPAQVAFIAQKPAGSPLTEAETAMMDFAEHVVRDASSITQQEIDTLRAHGFTDVEIFDITAAATARCFFSKTLDALGAEADREYRSLDDQLRNALTVGRPIAD
ncbi:MAG TPA: peroxidase [Bacteroidota bacterium]|nr:peroxidase [Bacteroidota bacterium]